MKTGAFVATLASAAALAMALLAPVRAAGADAFTTLEPGTLQVCLARFPPVADQQDGRWTGADVDYLRAFAEANGLAFEVVGQAQFADIWLGPGQGRCDIAAAGISDTIERRAATGSRGVWSVPYYEVVRAFLVRESDRAALTRIDDLEGRRVIVTRDSTAHRDLCYRMQLAGMRACRRNDGARACPDLEAVARKEAPDCVAVDWPRDDDEANAAADLLAAEGADPPFALGAGYVTVQHLARRFPGLAPAWPHCNMTAYEGRIAPYAERFSFVVSSESTGLLQALDAFIDGNGPSYAAGSGPELGCEAAPWTQGRAAGPPGRD